MMRVPPSCEEVCFSSSWILDFSFHNIALYNLCLSSCMYCVSLYFLYVQGGRSSESNRNITFVVSIHRGTSVNGSFACLRFVLCAPATKALLTTPMNRT